MDDRREFLLHMYDQMFNDINRHIIVVWQALVIIAGSIGLLALTEKNILPIEYAVTLIICLIFWGIQILIDSAYWYNRNLVIIANIEREFLTYDDLKNIHYYFGKHRTFKFIVHIRIQFILLISLIILSLIFFYFNGSNPNLFFLPYLALIIFGVISRNIYQERKAAYQEFIENSPGKEMDESKFPKNIKYGGGHPTEQKPKI